ncbi:MAG: eukaryotic-like serine/threonine-protein kinase [Actinomycetota bacterium]|nr:eukaryotic-like serine/threonine-protein kinase [Actinomycetota bacterium]
MSVIPGAGSLLGTRYLLTERIAGGGMGEVWRCSDQVLGRDVAVKILRREYADDPTFLERFRAEARHTAGLSHPGIAAVYDYGEEDGSSYLVMELVPGEPLATTIARDGAMSAERTLDLIAQSGFALQAAHDAGVIHRDIKPGNLLLTDDGTVKITDFGIARAANSVPLTQTGAIMGTAYYISPEQATGGSVSPASDIYSLGIVSYECLAGRRPFAGNTPVSVALAQVRDEPPALPEDVPAPVRELVMRMLAKEPADRPESAGSLAGEASALLAAGAGALVTAPTSTAPSVTRVMPQAETPDGTEALPPAGAAAVASQDAVPAHGPDRPPRRRWPLLLGLLGVALLVILLVRACGSAATSAPPSPDSTRPTSSSSGTHQVRVVASDYLGRPADQVTKELKAKGLAVAITHDPGGGTVGTVKAVSPTGRVDQGSTVTLTVVSEPQPSGGHKTKGHGKGHGKGDN